MVVLHERLYAECVDKEAVALKVRMGHQKSKFILHEHKFTPSQCSEPQLARTSTLTTAPPFSLSMGNHRINKESHYNLYTLKL
jgi:hypothetical protein